MHAEVVDEEARPDQVVQVVHHGASQEQDLGYGFTKVVFLQKYSFLRKIPVCGIFIFGKKYFTCLSPLLDEDHLALDVQSLVHFLKKGQKIL